MEALPGQSVGFQSAGRTTPAYEKNRQQNGVPAMANRSESAETDNRRMHGERWSEKNIPVQTERGGRDREREREIETRETERERQRDNSLLDAHMKTQRVTARANSAQRT